MPEIENPGRERVLARIRAALREAAPKRTASPGAGKIFPPVADPLARFREECEENKTECVLVSERSAIAAAVTALLASLPAGEIFVQDAPALRQMASRWGAERMVRWSSEGGPAESSQATITLAESLVAQTGSIFVSAACGGRGASVVAPVHIVVASIEQICPDLDSAFARLRESGALAATSFLCLITGSSRTADIEKILVHGAHGPRRLVVVLSLGGV